ncbi:NAD-dependent epimerase/dehydratase family protein [Paenibacillus turpanensis]|uniref:NAD-dependent epimerase/dehydratase family protein n=1 Tax=Paenibacillus turpanensis TaxID=2689078 RepID=UPI00140E4643|nr:NAD-dependent epimerase/dehydratase family protein [Paenibacillus turpanensis]
MKVLVTGGAGFIGSHLAEQLAAQGAEVHIADNLSTGKREYIPSGVTLHEQDITTEETADLVRSLAPKAVFHLAAQADVQRSIADPAMDADVNVLGTVRLLKACADASVGKLVFASTSAVYGDLEANLIQETDPAVPVSYYGLSKLSAEGYIRLFSRLYGLNYTILRYANVFGPRQTPKGEGGVVSQFMTRIFKGEPLTVFGDGGQTRDFVYVRDVVGANLAALTAGDRATVHVSTSQSTSVNELIALLERAAGTRLPVVHRPAREGDIRHSCLDNRLAGELLGYQPRYALDEALKETYSYYRTAWSAL